MEKSGFRSEKHKKLGYQMFKDKYIGKVKANVVKGRMSCVLVKMCKCCHKKTKHILFMLI